MTDELYETIKDMTFDEIYVFIERLLLENEKEIEIIKAKNKQLKESLLLYDGKFRDLRIKHEKEIADLYKFLELNKKEIK